MRIKIEFLKDDEDRKGSKLRDIVVETHTQRNETFNILKGENLREGDGPKEFKIEAGSRLVVITPKEDVVMDHDQNAAIVPEQQRNPDTQRADAPKVEDQSKIEAQRKAEEEKAAREKQMREAEANRLAAERQRQMGGPIVGQQNTKPHGTATTQGAQSSKDVKDK